MTSFFRRLYTPLFLDLMFAALATVCAIGLFRMSAVPIPSIASSDSPLAKGASLVGLAVASGLFATWTTRLDQKCADDYVFQTLTKSALMGIVGFIFAFTAWNALLADNLGRLASYATMALLLACWSVSYFIVRVRGTGA